MPSRAVMSGLKSGARAVPEYQAHAHVEQRPRPLFSPAPPVTGLWDRVVAKVHLTAGTLTVVSVTWRRKGRHTTYPGSKVFPGRPGLWPRAPLLTWIRVLPVWGLCRLHFVDAGHVRLG